MSKTSLRCSGACTFLLLAVLCLPLLSCSASDPEPVNRPTYNLGSASNASDGSKSGLVVHNPTGQESSGAKPKVNVPAAEVIPPKPKHYFNDYVGVVTKGTAQTLNRVLEEFERKTTAQVVVAIFSNANSSSSVKDYTFRIANNWGVGQIGKNNGVVLFIFVQDHEMYIQIGSGLEAAIPNATAKAILDTEMKPSLRRGDFDSALLAGVNAILQAARGEYQKVKAPER